MAVRSLRGAPLHRAAAADPLREGLKNEDAVGLCVLRDVQYSRTRTGLRGLYVLRASRPLAPVSILWSLVVLPYSYTRIPGCSAAFGTHSATVEFITIFYHH